MQRWEYRVVALRDRHYTAGLNEYGRDGWELVSVVSEDLGAAPPPERARGLPLPNPLGRLEQAADKLGKLGGGDAAESSPTPTSRLLWVFRRPLSDE